MGYSRYISAFTTSSQGGYSHTISNPDNESFSFAEVDHINIFLSDAGQALASFQSAVLSGTANRYLSHTLIGQTLTFSGLEESTSYCFQVKRVTPKATHFVDFQAGAPLTELALDNSNKYTLYRSQELEDDMGENLLTLAKMKALASVSGDFVDTTSTQTVSNKTLPSGGATGTHIDMGLASFIG